MIRLLPLASLLLLAGIVPLAAAPPEAPSANLYTQQNSRSIAIQNWSNKTVVVAEVHTTPDNKTWNLSHGKSLATNQASEIIVPARDCIANIHVKLEDGKTLAANGLNACRNTQIVVRNGTVGIAEQAVPGAKQHGTPG